MRLDKVTIIGVGLLGGSIGLALRKRKLAGTVVGYTRRQAAARDAVGRGAVDEAGLSLKDAVADADLVILCTPVLRMEALTRAMSPDLKRGAIVTDVGSVKTPVVQRLHSIVRATGAHFVGSHPMAGSERGGVGSARADMFENALCVVTPRSDSANVAVRKVKQLWESLGSQVLMMDAAVHDKLVSRASHLPHLLASVLTTLVLEPGQDPRQSELCATGFRDTTRIASGSATMWRDIALANRRNICGDLARFETRLRGLRKILQRNDAAALERLLAKARALRLSWHSEALCSSTE